MKKLSIFVIILAVSSAIIVACGGSATPTTAPAAGAADTAPTTAPAAAVAATTAPAVAAPVAAAAAVVQAETGRGADVSSAGGVSPGAVVAIAPVAGKVLSYGTFSGEMTLVDAPVYKESPFSAALVASGDLPPLEERLGTPLVLVVDEVGEYGGVMRRMQTNPLSVHGTAGRISHRGLLRASGDGKGFVPSGAGSYSPNEDGSVWTVKTRAGGKWSDGAPNTSEDYRYQWEILQNPDVMGGGAGWINNSGDPVVQAVVIDEETIEYRYSEPNWLFETQVARGHLPWDIPIYPSHYMKQYNGDYNPDAQKLAEAAGYESWELYYHANRDQWHNNPNLPSMASYLFENNTANQIVYFSRNHYYNMVDQEGNQLPYIDGMRIGPAKSGGDALALAAAQGEMDFQATGLNISYFTLLKAGEDKGGYKLKLVPDTAGTDISLTFGLTYDGPERELIENKDWRIAISQAINRDDINEALFFGQGTPRNGLPSMDHPFYPGPEYETLYFLDIAASNAALDTLMGPKDGDGFRTMPNGDRFEFVFTTPDSPLQISASEMMCLDIEAVSVRCLVDPLGGMLRVQRVRASQAMARPAGHCCTGELYMFPGTTLPVSRWGWAPDWGGWYQSGEGEEPPAEVKNLHTLFEGAKLAPDNAINSAKEIFTWYVENAVAPGIVGGLGSYAVIVVGNELAGVPDTWANRNGLQSPQNAFPERFYFTNAQRRAELPRQLTHCVGCAPEVQEAGFGWAP